jgi:hypothetical protein
MTDQAKVDPSNLKPVGFAIERDPGMFVIALENGDRINARHIVMNVSEVVGQKDADGNRVYFLHGQLMVHVIPDKK